MDYQLNEQGSHLVLTVLRWSSLIFFRFFNMAWANSIFYSLRDNKMNNVKEMENRK